MKKYLIFIYIVLLSSPLAARDLRQAYQQAAADQVVAAEVARQARQQIMQDRVKLSSAVAVFEKKVIDLKEESRLLEKQSAELSLRRSELEPERLRVERDLNTLAGNVRVTARDLKPMLSYLSVLQAEKVNLLDSVGADGRLPGMDDMRLISDLMFLELDLNDEVAVHAGTFLDRRGQDRSAQILTAGPFLAAYSLEGQVGLLNYADSRFFALSADEPRALLRNLKRYLAGKDDAVYLDLSGGAAVRQMVKRTNLKEQIMNGGAIVWPIMLLGLVALGLGIERTITLRRLHQDTDSLMSSINQHAAAGQWSACDLLLKETSDGSVPRILKSGLDHRNECRETLENVLQESILHELPLLERFLPTINILGAIAPLLGLLGTVSGMITTFQMITLYGTGDPRIMSGGISEALITTELGLAVAIPIMLMHTFLSRSVDHIVGDMEEKAVALSNIFSKCGDSL